MGVLSSSCAVLGVTAGLEELGQAEVERALEKFGREEWNVDGVENENQLERGDGVGEDIGVAIMRGEKMGEVVAMVPEDGSEHENVQGEAQPPLAQVEVPRKRSAAEPKAKATKKKRTKGGNAIDDLFGTL